MRRLPAGCCTSRFGGRTTSTASTSRLGTLTDGESWLAVGDAAVACDPLWGQGVLTALETGLAAAESLTGGAGALADLTAAEERRFRDFVRLRADYYGRETRWSVSVFWARRHRTRRNQTNPTT